MMLRAHPDDEQPWMLLITPTGGLVARLADCYRLNGLRDD